MSPGERERVVREQHRSIRWGMLSSEWQELHGFDPAVEGDDWCGEEDCDIKKAIARAYDAGASRLADVEAENDELRAADRVHLAANTARDTRQQARIDTLEAALRGTRKHVAFAHQHGYIPDEIAGGILADIDAALSEVKP